MSERVNRVALREQFLDDTAKVALALQFAIQHTPDGHEAFQRILELVPYDLRRPMEESPALYGKERTR